METLASIWAHDPSDPCDLRDLGEKRHELSSVWESQCVFSSSPPAALMWTQQLSPHLQRNKQLQDTLLQREEELARLQEENSKLREFLSSSFVRTLEEKAKKLPADGRRKLKRKLMDVNERSFPNCGHLPVASQPISKRVCRNLTPEFCSGYSETSVSSEQNLDLWVLRTLGLKDRDTIDTSNDSLCSPEYSLRGLVYDTAVTSDSSSVYSLSSLSPSVSTSPHSSAHSYCQSSTHQPEYRCSVDKCQEANSGGPAESGQNCTASPSSCSDLTAATLNGHHEAPEAVIRSSTILPFTQPPDMTKICITTASSQLQTSSQEHPVYWSPLTDSHTQSEDTVQFSTPGKIHFSPMLSSTPVSNQPWTPVRGCSPSGPSEGSQIPVTPHTPHSRTDLAFSMSLSMTSSVKTHSFPQGQAFIRKDTEGRWNFTWVPRH